MNKNREGRITIVQLVDRLAGRCERLSSLLLRVERGHCSIEMPAGF